MTGSPLCTNGNFHITFVNTLTIEVVVWNKFLKEKTYLAIQSVCVDTRSNYVLMAY